MNDVVFAGKLKIYEKQAQKFNKCLKVIVPAQSGEGGCIVYGESEKLGYAWGEYAVVPPYSYHEFKEASGEALIACIEQPLIPSSQGVVVAADTENHGMLTAVREAAAFWNGGAGGILAALGQLIVSYLTAERTDTPHPVVATLKADMEKNFTDSTYSAETALRKIPLNYDYVRKLFKKQTGVTPHDYLNGIRMNRARLYIENGITNNYSHFTVSQIAEACGFAEPLYFSRVFKNYFGVAPSQYLKNQ